VFTALSRRYTVHGWLRTARDWGLAVILVIDKYTKNVKLQYVILRERLGGFSYIAGKVHILYRIIQCVPGGMDKTSGQCSLC